MVRPREVDESEPELEELEELEPDARLRLRLLRCEVPLAPKGRTTLRMTRRRCLPADREVNLVLPLVAPLTALLALRVPPPPPAPPPPVAFSLLAFRLALRFARRTASMCGFKAGSVSGGGATGWKPNSSTSSVSGGGVTGREPGWYSGGGVPDRR